MTNLTNPVVIRQIVIYKSKIRLKEPFVISLGAIEFSENIIVAIKTNQGSTGFGECSPFMTIHGETMDTGFIVGQLLARQLIGKNVLDIEGCIRKMDALIFGNTSIKSAFDMAIFDLASQHAGIPLYRFLGGRNNKKLVTDYTVSFGEVAKMADDAKKIIADGFTILKVKLGGTKDMDLARVIAIREAVGMMVPIRVDANQGWETDTAIAILNAIGPLNIQFCEEPIPRWNFMDLSKIKMASPVPILADESCCNQHDAKRLMELGACDGFNIKTGKSSGIFNAMQIIRMAERQHLKLQIGGFLESRLGFTAAAHLAFTSDDIRYVDFDTPLMFETDPITGGIIYGAGGLIHVPDQPGLGAVPDPHYLNSLEQVNIN